MIKLTRYTCEYCGENFGNEEICKKHELECLNQQKIKKERDSKKIELIENVYLIYANDKDDFYYLTDITTRKKIESYNYPCWIIYTSSRDYVWKNESTISEYCSLEEFINMISYKKYMIKKELYENLAK